MSNTVKNVMHNSTSRNEKSVTIHSHNHRTVGVRRDLWRSSGPTPPAQAGPPKAQDYVQKAFEYL